MQVLGSFSTRGRMGNSLPHCPLMTFFIFKKLRERYHVWACNLKMSGLTFWVWVKFWKQVWSTLRTTFCGYGTCNVIAINTSPPSLYQFAILIATLELTLKKKKKYKNLWLKTHCSSSSASRNLEFNWPNWLVPVGWNLKYKKEEVVWHNSSS